MDRRQKDSISVKMVIDRFDGKNVILKHEEEEFFVAKKLLPKESKLDDSIVVTIATEKNHSEMMEKTAKEIINEILNSN